MPHRAFNTLACLILVAWVSLGQAHAAPKPGADAGLHLNPADAGRVVDYATRTLGVGEGEVKVLSAYFASFVDGERTYSLIYLVYSFKEATTTDLWRGGCRLLVYDDTNTLISVRPLPDVRVPVKLQQVGDTFQIIDADGLTCSVPRSQLLTPEK